MKRGKKPTLRQKQAMRYVNIKPEDWLVYKVERDWLHIRHRHVKQTKIIPA